MHGDKFNFHEFKQAVNIHSLLYGLITEKYLNML